MLYLMLFVVLYTCTKLLQMEVTMNKHEIFIGLNDKDIKVQVIPTEEAMLKVHALVGDCSMSLIQGYFTHADGSMVVEKNNQV